MIKQFSTGALIAFFVVMPLAAFAQAHEKREVEDITRQIIVKQSLREDKQLKRADLREKISIVQKDIEQLQVKQVNLAGLLQQTQSSVDFHSTAADRQNQIRLAKARELLRNLVTSEQLRQRNPFVMLVLQNDPLKVDRLYHYHKAFLNQMSEQFRELESIQSQLQDQLNKTQRAHDELLVINNQFTVNRDELDNRKERLTLLTTALDAEIELLNSDVARLEQERENLSRLISQRTSRGNRTSPSPTPATRTDVSGWPVVGQLSRKFGSLRADGRLKTEGIFISAREGAPVIAVANGTVVFAQWLQGYGNTLVIDHGDELISLYANCEELHKHANEPVEAGEIIASTGYGDEKEDAGLYFEIRVRNNPTDPLNWLSKR